MRFSLIYIFVLLSMLIAVEGFDHNAVNTHEGATKSPEDAMSLVADAGPDRFVIRGMGTVIGGSPTASGDYPPFRYLWTPTHGLDDPLSPNPIATIEETTTYTVTVLDSRDNAATDDVRLTIRRRDIRMDCNCDSRGITVVFCIDTTGSMGGTIRNIREGIESFAFDLYEEYDNVRFGIVTFGDSVFIHDFDPDEEGAQLTSSLADIQRNLSAMGASGGGDGPEVSLDAIYFAIERYGLVKANILLFTDAPSHYAGDTRHWPDGTPFSRVYPEDVIEALLESQSFLFSFASPYSDVPFGDYNSLADTSGGAGYPLNMPMHVISDLLRTGGMVTETEGIELRARNPTTRYCVINAILDFEPYYGISLLSDTEQNTGYLEPSETGELFWSIEFDSLHESAACPFELTVVGCDYEERYLGVSADKQCYLEDLVCLPMDVSYPCYMSCYDGFLRYKLHNLTGYVVNRHSIELRLNETHIFDLSDDELSYNSAEAVVSFAFREGLMLPGVNEIEIRATTTRGHELTNGFYRLLYDNIPPEIVNFNPPEHHVFPNTGTGNIVVEIIDREAGIDPESIVIDIECGSFSSGYTMSSERLEFEAGVLYFRLPYITGAESETLFIHLSVSDAVDVCEPNMLEHVFTYLLDIEIVSENIVSPYILELSQNMPNPFNPVTRIDFTLSEDGEVRLDVYDIMGGYIANLAEGYHTAGRYSRLFDASELNGGVYFYRLVGEGFDINKKMLYIK